MATKQTDKCARKRQHDWKTERETKDVIMYQCEYCHGRKWVTRRN